MAQNAQTASLTYQGALAGHSGWVTTIATGNAQKQGEDNRFIISGSRDKTLMIWKLFDQPTAEQIYGEPLKRLTGHNHFVESIALSQENSHAISCSWDKTLRMWDLKTGSTCVKFNGHTREVFDVSFSQDNRYILSAGADRRIRLWNIMGQCKHEVEKDLHHDWVSGIQYSPIKTSSKQANFQPYFVTVGQDGRLKIWDVKFVLKNSFMAHEGGINAVEIAPQGMYIATGGKDGKLKIWDITKLDEPIIEKEVGAPINKIAFNPEQHWIAVATDKAIKLYNLQDSETESKAADIVVRPTPFSKDGSEPVNKKTPATTSLKWSSQGRNLFAGCSDGVIRVYQFTSEKAE